MDDTAWICTTETVFKSTNKGLAIKTINRLTNSNFKFLNYLRYSPLKNINKYNETLRDKCTLLLRKALEQNVQKAHVMSMRQGDEFYRKPTAQRCILPSVSQSPLALNKAR